MAENVAPSLLKHLRAVFRSPIEGITVEENEENLTELYAWIDGPVSTPFEGGRFRIVLRFEQDYPATPPRGKCLTKVFHPNIAPDSGDICVNTLKRDWKPTEGLRHIFQVIRCLLIAPNPDSALNEEAARLMISDFELFSKRAKLFTELYARPRPDCKEDHEKPTQKSTSGKASKRQKKNLKRL